MKESGFLSDVRGDTHSIMWCGSGDELDTDLEENDYLQKSPPDGRKSRHSHGTFKADA